MYGYGRRSHRSILYYFGNRNSSNVTAGYRYKIWPALSRPNRLFRANFSPKALENHHYTQNERFLVVSVVVFAVPLSRNFEDGFGESLDVTGGDAGNRDTTVLGSINGMLLSKSVHLPGLQTGIRKHSDLVGNV